MAFTSGSGSSAGRDTDGHPGGSQFLRRQFRIVPFPAGSLSGKIREVYGAGELVVGISEDINYAAEIAYW